MRRAARSERGSGVLSATFGVMVFLSLLTFAAHVLLGLWVRSTVDAVATDAATDVALSGVPAVELARVEEAALARARQALGSHADQVRLHFEDDPRGRSVILRVRTRGIGLFPGLDALGAVDRRIVVRREVP